jgi:hypothetical protein
MNAVGVTIISTSLVFASAAIAKNPQNSSSQGLGQLKQALAAVAATADPQGPKPPDHFSAKTDRDQGDDHANPRAILKVCSKDTPAAHRAAICPTGISPD